MVRKALAIHHIIFICEWVNSQGTPHESILFVGEIVAHESISRISRENENPPDPFTEGSWPLTNCTSYRFVK